MKKANKLAAAIAVALGVGIAPQANAMVLKHNGKGDALIFPVYEGRVDNYYAISNASAEWIQGHIRFRGAAWSAEVRDFDVILSPGDVFVFRIADLDGDGGWEIDQSLDPRNFAYTGQTYSCGSVANCLEPNFRLIDPVRNDSQVQPHISHQEMAGYVEFFGEAVLDNMTHEIMNDLLTAAPNTSNIPYQDALYARTGTNAWRWSDAANGFRVCTTPPTTTRAGTFSGSTTCDNGLLDVPNVLSGSGFIHIPGRSQGVAYNAEAFVDFRTALGWGTHRIDNYRATGYVPFGINPMLDSAVIVHDESGSDGTGVSPFGDYVYHFPTGIPVDPVGGPGMGEDRQDEALISFNNTWGPTLADGDDYSALLAGLRALDATMTFDDWEMAGLAGGHFLPTPPFSPSTGNSIAEVEEEIRIDGQAFTSYYFDGQGFSQGDSLHSFFFMHFPTKFYYGENVTYYGQSTLEDYIRRAVRFLINLAKPLNIEIWDINEIPGGQVMGGCISPDPCAIVTAASMGHELSFFDVGYFKRVFNTGTAQSFTHGRVVVAPVSIANNPLPLFGDKDLSWPGLGYTFEIGGSGDIIGQWRSMHR